jgi:hypothetical protein
MLDQLVHWADIASSVLDLLLLLRILGLRLHRIYSFVTLYCVVNVMMDVADLAVGSGSHQAESLFVYSRFLTVLVFPLAAWDCFEGLPPSLLALRRPQLIRLISGMLLTSVFALLIGSTADDNLSSFDVTAEVGLIMWLSAAAASLGFVWIMRRLARVQKVPLSPNTATLSLYFVSIFALELLSGVLVVLAQTVKNLAQILEVVLAVAGIAITAWCILRLQKPTDAVSSTGNDLVRR